MSVVLKVFEPIPLPFQDTPPIRRKTICLVDGFAQILACSNLHPADAYNAADMLAIFQKHSPFLLEILFFQE